MTNYWEKLQMSIFKNEFKREANKKHDINYFMLGNDDYIYCCIAGTHIHRIHKQFFYLDISKLKFNESIERLYQENATLSDQTMIYSGYTKEKGKAQYMEYKSENNEKTMYFDKRLIEEYGGYQEITLFANVNNGPYAPVIVKDNYTGYGIGLLLPCKVDN